MIKTQYNVIASLSATLGNNLSLENHILTVVGAKPMDFRKIISVGAGYLLPVAETAGVITLTNSGAASTAFSFELRQYRPDLNMWVSNRFSHTSPATGATTTTVSNALRDAVNADPAFKVTTSGGATAILTADAGFPLIFATSFSGAALTVAATTPGVASRGTADDLLRAGVAAGDVAAGATYAQIKFDFEGDQNHDYLINAVVQSQIVYVTQGIANLAAFETYMGEVLQAFPSGLTTSDPEALALSGA